MVIFEYSPLTLYYYPSTKVKVLELLEIQSIETGYEKTQVYMYS